MMFGIGGIGRNADGRKSNAFLHIKDMTSNLIVPRGVFSYAISDAAKVIYIRLYNDMLIEPVEDARGFIYARWSEDFFQDEELMDHLTPRSLPHEGEGERYKHYSKALEELEKCGVVHLARSKENKIVRVYFKHHMYTYRPFHYTEEEEM